MLRRPISMQPSSPASVSQILHLPMDSFIHHPSHPYSPVLTPSETKGHAATARQGREIGFDLIDYHAHAGQAVTKRGFENRRRKQSTRQVRQVPRTRTRLPFHPFSLAPTDVASRLILQHTA